MLLKTLSLAGFKSFATRTRLEFDSGVNVVVGPNGSGKSNLLDALAWAMGTQATRTLRTARMEDVIFAGTATRPPVGRAEVTVTFDNRDRFLPIELDEVSMTRRLYRDGTSEYELNRAPCRLLDLQDLLSDGGVGRHQHVLVGQGHIGDILSARPDEHRAVIEEAAGVTKHRARRDRSLSRLEQTDLDLARLTDIVDQERRRLRPLARQAKAASQHGAIRAEIRALRLWLAGEELRRMIRRADEAGGERDALELRIDHDSGEVAALTRTVDELGSVSADFARSLERDTAAAARLETVVERFARIATVAGERSRSLQSRLEGAGERRSDVEAEQQHLHSELAALEGTAQEARRVADHREVELQALEDEERSLAEQIRMPAEGMVAALRGDLRSLEVAAERDRREADSVGRRRDVVQARLDEERHEAETVVAEIQAVDAEAVEAQEAYERSRQVRETAQSALEEAEADHHERRLDAARASARVGAVEEALAGLGDPEARRRAAASEDVVGTVVSRLDVPEDVAQAVDGALGQWSDALATVGPEALQRLAASLKAEGFGGLTLVVGATSACEVPAREVAVGWGGEALVDRLGPGADVGLASRLLGDVVVVEGWSVAWRLVERHPGLRAVTPEGDVVSIRGMRLADVDGAGHAALESARVRLEIAEREQARSASRLTTAKREYEAARHVERESLETLERLEARLAGHAETLALNGRARAEGEAEVVRLDERSRALAEAGAVREQRMAELRARLADLEGEEARVQQLWETLNDRRREVAGLRDRARRLREDAAAAVAGVDERRRMLAGRLDAIGLELADLDSVPADPEEIARLAALEARARDAATACRDHVHTLRDRQRSLREQAAVADGSLDAARRRRRKLEEDIARGKDRAATLAVELAELRVRSEAVGEAVHRDADASEDEALAAPRPAGEGDDFSARLEDLEARLRRLGPINPLAAAEHDELASHVEMLEGQLADLHESRSELRKVIAALDDEMAHLFRKAFDEISELYAANFALVFPGGRGRLRLTDPDHPLETGVELEAQPLGKKVGRLSLLSGGERSLAALAFLFAVFRARPSPFYVLDEVEAALDDANLRRFVRLVDTLRSGAQLVIITHQPQTMEAADLLYGVTMEPGDTSKVVSKRLIAYDVLRTT